ncbi:hypothetical protein ACQVP2_30345 [Methylobacterium aquaticum]|uniref:hypothetical protein n=1 Tax=Methylobacterium aquaticum TaxID=270351 RepID=UPI003D17D518
MLSYALALQLLLTGLVGVTSALPDGPNSAGPVLCRPTIQKAPATADDGAEQPRLPACCTFGCVAGPLLPVPEAFTLLRWRIVRLDAVRSRVSDLGLGPTTGPPRLCRGPRPPPSLLV